MATRVARFQPARKRYPWKTWTNGSAWRATKGKDFHCTIPGFESALYQYSKRKGIPVRVARKGDAVEFQFGKGK